MRIHVFVFYDYKRNYVMEDEKKNLSGCKNVIKTLCSIFNKRKKKP